VVIFCSLNFFLMQISCPNESYYTGTIQCNAIEYLVVHKTAFKFLGGNFGGIQLST
jgi:hypothetical protein